jgi:hypothetical protein
MCCLNVVLLVLNACNVDNSTPGDRFILPKNSPSTSAEKPHTVFPLHGTLDCFELKQQFPQFQDRQDP